VPKEIQAAQNRNTRNLKFITPAFMLNFPNSIVCADILCRPARISCTRSRCLGFKNFDNYASRVTSVAGLATSSNDHARGRKQENQKVLEQSVSVIVTHNFQCSLFLTTSQHLQPSGTLPQKPSRSISRQFGSRFQVQFRERMENVLRNSSLLF